MNSQRIIAITVIYLIACLGWSILGTTTAMRSDEVGDRLGGALEKSWGTALIQAAPDVVRDGTEAGGAQTLLLTASQVRVSLQAEHRRKGLVWYPTYVCGFDASYTVANDGAAPLAARLRLAFPKADATYEGFAVSVDGSAWTAAVDIAAGLDLPLRLDAGARQVVRIAYTTRGIGSWRYLPAGEAGRVRGLDLVVATDFRAVDYPAGALSPMRAEASDTGMTLTWATSDLITRQEIGVIVPERLNPGPLASRITWFAPVCLGFFFVLIATLSVVQRIDVHPMHYLFIASGFAAFHVLLAYLVDQLDIHASFAVAAIASLTLVVSYLAAAVRGFPWKAAAAGQLFFLVLFSYSFFLKGMTGMTVAIGSVVTLAVLMKVTAGVDWNEVFARRSTVTAR
ncbi:MAG: inner membrane CreD family protein [Planctomycetes bacterium]|nr:inner membrane CreD family protein [Planctomycetota bacterium]